MARKLLVSNSLLRNHTLSAALNEIGAYQGALDFYAASPHLTISLHKDTDTTTLAQAIKSHNMSIGCLTAAPYRYSLCYASDSTAGVASMAYFTRAIRVADELSSGLVILPSSQGELDLDIRIRQQNTLDNLMRLASLEHKSRLAIEIPLALPGEKSVWSINFVREITDKVPDLHFAFSTRMLLLSIEGWQCWLKAANGKSALIRLVDGNWHTEKPWCEGVIHHQELHSILSAVDRECVFSSRLHADLEAQDAQTWQLQHMRALNTAIEVSV